MQFDRLPLDGLLMVTPRRFCDERGWFSECFREDRFRGEVGEAQFVQHNQSSSVWRGTVRGLVRCSRGRVLDVAVDLRSSSPTYGRHVAVELSAQNGRQLWVPAGFAHGFCTLEDGCELAYMVTDYYSPEHDRGLRWNDPALGIDWPVDEADAILSSKDTRQPLLADLGAVFA